MRFTSRLVVALSFLSAGLTLTAQQPSPAEALFQKGLMLERAEGNLTQAIVLYERVVAEYPKDAVVVPQALYHLARVYEKTDTQRATRMWTRIATEYGTTQYAGEARRKLADAQSEAAGPFRMRVLDAALAGLDWSDVSGDGRLAAYIKRDASGDHLMLRDLDAGRDRQLAGDARRKVTDPEISPDSRLLAYQLHDVRTVEATEDGPHEVRIVTIATGQVRTIATVPSGRSDYTWAPDSQQLAAHLGRVGDRPSGSLQVLDARTGESRKLVSPAGAPAIAQPIRPAGGMFFSWSADSREFAFLTTTAALVDEFWIASAGTGQVRALPMSLKASGPRDRITLSWGTGPGVGGPFDGGAWRTNGQLLLRQASPAGTGASFLLLSITGGTAAPICTMARPQHVCGSVTPDGKMQIVENTESHRVTLVDLGTGTGRRISAAFGDEETPTLSPDGRLLAYLSNPDGKWAVYVVPVDKAPVYAPVRLVALDGRPNNVSALAWGRDGRLLVNLEYGTNDVYRINMDRSGHATGPAGRLTQDTANNFTASPSPDSARIAYWYVNGSRRGTAVMMADGSGEHPIADGASGPWGWLNGDEVLTSRSSTATTPNALTALNVKTGAARTVAEFGIAPMFDYQFVRSLNEVVYWEGERNAASRTIRARSLADGKDRVLATIETRAGLIGFVLSPDGRTLAYSRWLDSTDPRRAEMHLLTIDGQADRIVATTSVASRGWRAETPYEWSPDGRFLLYDEFPGSMTGTLRVMDVRTRESWPIPEATNSETIRWYNTQWSPDGSYLTISRWGSRSEYRAFDGVTYDAVVKLLAGRK